VRYHVHPKVHAEWGDQSLYFMFFSFRLSYDAQALADALDEAFAQHDVTAQVTYELIGRFDLMLRVWLSHARLRAFRATLKEKLNPLSLQNDAVWYIAEVVRHWPWGSRGSGYDRRGPLREPDERLLLVDRTPAILRTLNEVTSADEPDVARAEELVNQELLAELPTEPAEGIKLVTLVDGNGLSNQEVDALQGLFARRLDEADPTVFSECSLYRSESNETPFIFMCRVAPSAWEHINTALYGPIQDLLIGKGRTSTYAVMRQGVVPFSDALATNPGPSSSGRRATVADLLADDESETFEVKATAFGAIDPWLHGRGDIVESDKLFERGVLKSVVGFLNSSGGSVLVGALEAERYSGLSPEVDMKLDHFTVCGQYVCLGLLDPTFVADGWDKYARRIADILDTRITGTPVATRAVVVEKQSHLDHEFCVVHVEAPPDDHWFYGLGSGGERSQRFYVRSGARVIELQGADADRYKRTKAAERANGRSRVIGSGHS
jgi:hypothetical protein